MTFWVPDGLYLFFGGIISYGNFVLCIFFTFELWGGFCPRGLCRKGFCPSEFLSFGDFVLGDFVLGNFVLGNFMNFGF